MKNRRIAAAVYLAFASLALIRNLSAQEGLSINVSNLYGGFGSPYSTQLQASGGDSDVAYNWTVVSGPSWLSLQSATGTTVTLSGTPPAGGTFSVTVKVTNGFSESGPPPSVSKTFTVGILQITTSSPLPTATTGQSYSVALAAAYTPGPYSWNFQSESSPVPGLTLSSGGVLSGMPTQTGQFSVPVSVFDDSAEVGTTMTFSLLVQSGFAINTSSTLAPGMVGMGYSEILTATGGTGPYTFTVSKGFSGNNLPPGLSLNGNGTISGIPTLAGSFLVNFTVTDATGAQAFANITITITPALVITTASPLPSASATAAYSQTISATGGMPPYSFSISGSAPLGLILSTAGVLSGTPAAAGALTFTVEVTDSFNFTATKQFQLTVAGAAALLQVSPTQLSFSAVAGSDAPAPQDVTILSASGTAVNFAAQVVASAGGSVPSWLTVSPATGTTPGRLVVKVNQGSLVASPAPATIQITVPGNSAQAPILVSVSLTLTTVSAQLQVTPPLLRFAALAQTPETLEQAIVVSGGGIGFTTSIQSHSSWITGVTPSSGQTEPNAPVVLKVDINTQGLSLGRYQDVIVINSSGGSVSVPVSVFIAGSGPILGVNVTGVRFLARQGLGSAVPRTVSVLNTGDPSSTLNWTATLLSGTNWLTGNPGGGTATATAPGSLVLLPATNSSGFAVGGQYALVQISAPGALNSPQYVLAVLDVEPASSPVVPELIPAGLFFVSPPTGLPGAQSVQVYASSTPVAFQVATTTADGANWLTATVTTPNASTTIPGKITISANPAGLSDGVYTGGVNVSIGSVLRTVNVTLVVAPELTPTDRPGGLQPMAAAGCTPSHLAVTETSLENNFAVPAGWPATLVVQLNDDCGNAVPNGSVVASFSNGDPPISLINQSDLYSATWQPSAVEPQMTVNVAASAPSFPQATAQFIGAVNANAANPPTLVPNGALHIFFNSAEAATVGAGLAPGNVAQVYGTGLASVATSTGSVPLTTNFNGTSMLIGGLLAPLFYVSPYPPGLLDVQIPSELTPNQQYQLIVVANNAYTLPETIDVVPYQPGVASLSDGSAIAQHADYSLVNAASPAKPGENLVIYLAGMGATNPPVPSGNPTPLQAVYANVQPTVTVGGQNAAVLYAGLTPTGVGLYQINFTVPASATTGSLSLVVNQNGTLSNATTLPVVAP